MLSAILQYLSVSSCLIVVLVQLFLYRRVKYKDDGRELVSMVEFITIHVTFPILNAWISYMLAYQIMITLAQSCPWTGVPD